ncbi:LacI family DNA-binding transcriptional regulator, partial [bacterium]|nr:LacI family DNA-binding transcriptional regulator [bacterium]
MRKPAGKGVREIAAETGFNISTVSRALNNRPGVSAQAAAEIIRAARK